MGERVSTCIFPSDPVLSLFGVKLPLNGTDRELSTKEW